MGGDEPPGGVSTPSAADIKKAILEAVNRDTGDVRRDLMELPDKLANTLREFTPVLTGRTEKSIEVKTRKSELKKLSTRRTKIGSVYSDDDPERVAAIEYGRGADQEHGATPEFAMFRRAVAAWEDREL